MPNIGYGSNKKTRHMLPTGFKKVLVHNVKVSQILFLKVPFVFSPKFPIFPFFVYIFFYCIKLTVYSIDSFLDNKYFSTIVKYLKKNQFIILCFVCF